MELSFSIYIHGLTKIENLQIGVEFYGEQEKIPFKIRPLSVEACVVISTTA